MNPVNPNTAGLPAGVLPIHVGRGEEAQARHEAGATGQNLTAQHIMGTEQVNAPVINPEVAAAAASIAVEAQPTPEVQAPVRERYEDSVKYRTDDIAGTVVSIGLQVEQEVLYSHKMIVDWANLNEAVMFVFVQADGTIIGSTEKPVFDEETNDFVMKSGQYMPLGNVPVEMTMSFELTLTEREEVKAEPVNELMPVNPVEEVKVDEEQPYYFNWGQKRRKRERARLRGLGEPVPADL